MQKRITLVGTNHQVQALDNGGVFRQVLICLVKKHNPEVIFEEWDRPGLWSTVGCTLAQECNPRLPWHSVDTPDEPQFKTDDVLREPGCPPIRMYGPIQNQINREGFFIEKIKELMANYNDGLFICGLNHVHSMSEKLVTLGLGVQAYTWQEPIC